MHAHNTDIFKGKWQQMDGNVMNLPCLYFAATGQ